MRVPIVAWILCCSALACAAPKAKLGAYYFDGWTSKTNHLKPRLIHEFADREPVWGWYDDSLTTVEKQIECAVDGGISFFAFDWYYPEGPEKRSHLNTGLDLYLQARNRDRLEFCLLVANHGGFRIGPKDWEAVCDLWVPLLKHRGHLKIAGKPLLIFFSPQELVTAFETTASLASAMDRLQRRARAEGLPGVEIAACATPGPEKRWSDLQRLAASGFTCFTGYNYHGYGSRGRGKEQPFDAMVDGHLDIWNRFATKNTLPYLPVVTAGWDKRPWEDAGSSATQSVYYPDRTPQKVGDFVKKAIGWMDANPGKTFADRLVILYAWNEYGEGGYIAPTRGTGSAYLEAIRSAAR